MEQELDFVGGTGHHKLGALPTVPAGREQRGVKRAGGQHQERLLLSLISLHIRGAEGAGEQRAGLISAQTAGPQGLNSAAAGRRFGPVINTNLSS